jgi:hypothetical protein
VSARQTTNSAEEVITKNAGLYVCAIVAQRASYDALLQFANDAPNEIQLIGQGNFTAVAMVPRKQQHASSDRKDLVQQLMINQQLIEMLMEIAPVLPVKFGTLAPNRKSVEVALEKGSEKFAAAFNSFSDKIQFDVVVTWDVAKVFVEIAKEPAIAKLKADLAATLERDGPANLDQLGKLVKETLDLRRTETCTVLLDMLLPVGVDNVVNQILDDSIVLNLALLVDVKSTETLDHCLNELDKIYHGALTFRCVGPLPPHSFGTIEINYLEPGTVKQACDILELDVSCSKDQVRSAYHRLVKKSHPDVVNDDVLGGSGRVGITVLSDAYKTLLSFVEEGGPVIVSVKRQEAAYAAGMS